MAGVRQRWRRGVEVVVVVRRERYLSALQQMFAA
jgi:short-subunit dehydrogenase